MKRIVYHHDDPDGWGAAACILYKHGKDVELREYSHGKPYELVEDYDEVYIVDFSFPNEEMKKLVETNNRVIWIDHHRSAMRNITEKLEGLRDPEVAACLLTWKYLFSNKKAPKIVEHIADEDMWRFENENTKVFMMFLNSILEKNDEVHIIRRMIKHYNPENYERAYAEGRIIKRFLDRQINLQAEKAIKIKVFNHKAIMVFASIQHSYIGNALLQLNPDVEIAVVVRITENNDGKINFRYALRSRAKGVDVGKLAYGLGGGGHYCAAGFQSEKLILE